MLGLLLVGGLLGALVLGDAFDSSNPPAEVEDEPAAPEGIDLVLTSDSDATLTGTEGDDTLTSEGLPNTGTSTDVVFLGGGDDLAETDLWGADIYGGDGDDTMTANATEATLYGDAGDDVLSVTHGADAYGGEGNDILTFDTTSGGSSEASLLNGGAGDDDLVNTRVIGGIDDQGHYGGVSMTGGEGQDNFTLELELSNGSADFADTVVNNSGGRITDFDPAEDSLVIEIERGPETADREMTSATLNDTSYSYSGVTYTSTALVMTFEGNANSDETQVRVTLDNVTGLTMDDIVINFV